MTEVSEADWKIFNKSLNKYKERISKRILIKIIEVIKDKKLCSAEKITIISNVVTDHERKMVSSLSRISRSQLFNMLVFFYGHDVVGNDIKRYSKQVQKSLSYINETCG